MILSQPLPISNIFNCLDLVLEGTQPERFSIYRDGVLLIDQDFDAVDGTITINMRSILIDMFTNSGHIDDNGEVVTVGESIIHVYSHDPITFTAQTGLIGSGGPVLLEQKPDLYSFVQDCKDVILQADVSVSIKFKKNGVEFLDEQYFPYNGKINIRMKDILNDMLSSEIMYEDGYHIQENQSATINVLYGNQNIEFIAISGGIGSQNIDTNVFLPKHFLTNSPQIQLANKKYKYYLSFFSALVGNTLLESMHTLVVRIYFKVPLPLRYIDFTFTDFSYNAIYTYIFDYDYLFHKFGSVAFDTVDIFLITKKNIPETTTSYTHRFIFNKQDNINDDIFMFENCMGANETICFDGQMEMSENHKSTTFKILEKTSEFKTDFSKKYKKNTGFFRSEDRHKFASEFFSSKKRYHLVNGIFKEIYLINTDANSIPLSVNDYTFEFSYSEDNRYRYSSRIDTLPTY